MTGSDDGISHWWSLIENRCCRLTRLLKRLPTNVPEYKQTPRFQKYVTSWLYRVVPKKCIHSLLISIVECVYTFFWETLYNIGNNPKRLLSSTPLSEPFRWHQKISALFTVWLLSAPEPNPVYLGCPNIPEISFVNSQKIAAGRRG